ncbi:DNA polymerase III subunit alpha [Johnsonella ignava]|uniref:DNA polymerase III subunit alpha n=1 Tax=Johnsonella ignava TaxID=43995 RepID=UPI0023F2C420|nr:DNA polymerase III subunit alpha [Johnsonella ignava]
MAFTHLHTHTEYSLLDGSSKIEEIIARAKELGMDSLAITDHGVMYGVVNFYIEAKNAGIKPILGSEVYVSPGSRFDREKVAGEDRYYHLVLLAENNTGYANLMKIVSKGFTDGFYYKPRVDYEILRRYSEGIIALSACLAGEVARNITRNKYDEAKEAALRYKEIFGAENFFLELQDHGYSSQKLVNQSLLKMSRETGIKLVATNDVHYTLEEDAAAHDILLCIQTAKKVSDKDRLRYEGGQFFLKSETQMKELFPYAPDAIENTHEIAKRCNVEMEFGVTKLPEYEVPDGHTAFSYMKKICYRGLAGRYGGEKDIEAIKEKLDFELEVIDKMGYVDYFLIVWDYISFAKSKGIAVGPGRGSAAGSIASYCMGITDIDPIKYNLIFERFLNPERVTMPDIDVDFCYERRQEVIDYVVEKYGKDRVCQIITFGTMAARGVIRDVGRVLDFPYARCDAVAKMIPFDLKMTLDTALKQSRELKNLYDNDPDIKRLVNMSKRLEGLPRHSSMHAAGVVISKSSVDDYVPIAKAADGSITTQFTMGILEKLGLLKMDFLGLRTLTVIQNTIEQVEKKYGRKINILEIDYDDPKVYGLISAGKTEGIFQLESSGMSSFMTELRPESMEDIIAGISLYRPGPMDFIPKYIKGKHERSSVTYDIPELEPILSPTYGCIVYQEQVMQMVRELAGFSLGESDMIRRAMSKKKADEMERQRKYFVYGNEETGVPGCLKNGISKEKANKIFDEMTDFANYAFNKSHAACYAFVSYQTAYLKYYYPEEFMAAIMTSVMDNTSKVAEYIISCRRMNISILPPDVNEGEGNFSVSENGIRFGLSAIKGVGRAVSDEIVKNRENQGRFNSLEDFINRLSNKEVNKRTIENFIKSGALDSLPGNRKQKLQISAVLLDEKSKSKKENMTGQLSLFDVANDEMKKDLKDKSALHFDMPDAEEFSLNDILAFEKETLGVYVSGHPLDQYVDIIDKNTNAKTVDFNIIKSEDGSDDTKSVLVDGQRAVIGGIISTVNIKNIKNMQTMAFVTLEDMFGSVEVVVFPKVYEEYAYILKEDNKVFISGRINLADDAQGKLICNKIVSFDEVKKQLWVQYENLAVYKADLDILMNDIKEHPGKDELIIYLKEEKAKKVFENEKNLNADIVFNILAKRIGNGNVKCVPKHLKL